MKSNNNASEHTTWSDYLKSWTLYPLPHHLVSRLIFKLTRLHRGSRHAIVWFIKIFNVDMSEASGENPLNYETFNAFFTRALKPGARPVTPHPLGNIENEQLFQAKGRNYSLFELLGGQQTDSLQFANGSFATIYLSPRDYHRVHMPEAGRLCSQTHIPGRLFSVAPHTVRCIPNLFARNERLVCQFDTSIGAMALIMVGAINVGAIETVWDGLVTPPAGKKILHMDFPSSSSEIIAKGDEMGRFNMGSTVIVIFERQVKWLPQIRVGESVKMGQAIAESKALPDRAILS